MYKDDQIKTLKNLTSQLYKQTVTQSSQIDNLSQMDSFLNNQLKFSYIELLYTSQLNSLLNEQSLGDLGEIFNLTLRINKHQIKMLSQNLLELLVKQKNQFHDQSNNKENNHQQKSKGLSWPKQPEFDIHQGETDKVLHQEDQDLLQLNNFENGKPNQLV